MLWVRTAMGNHMLPFSHCTVRRLKDMMLWVRLRESYFVVGVIAVVVGATVVELVPVVVVVGAVV